MGDTSPLQIDRLRTLREQRGWSRRELARQCGIGEAQIGKYESGQIDPTATSLKIIADKFDVSTDYLLGISDDPNRRIDTTNLSEEEYTMVRAYRTEGWPGVLHLGVDRMAR